MLSCVAQQTTRKFELETFATQRSWNEYTVRLEEPDREVKAECRERAVGTEACAFTGV